MTSLVRYAVDDHAVAFVTLDSPRTRNALSDKLLDDLLSALADARADDGVRAVVLGSSHERIFSAGGDLKAFAGDAPTITKYAGLDRFPRLYQAISGLGKPVICAEAPIFELVDFGVVGDLHKVLPAATDDVKNRKG